MAGSWVVWLVCGWFGWLASGLNGLCVVSGFATNVLVDSSYNVRTT